MRAREHSRWAVGCGVVPPKHLVCWFYLRLATVAFQSMHASGCGRNGAGAGPVLGGTPMRGRELCACRGITLELSIHNVDVASISVQYCGTCAVGVSINREWGSR